MSFQLDTAYSVCRDVARSQAKNFYYSFLALPKEKRNAICAVYAFMRQADDIADDETMPRDARRVRLQKFIDDWHHAATHESDDPVFMALSDTQKRFNIPHDLLDALVRGTAMDLIEGPPAEPARRPSGVQTATASTHKVVYRSFQDLYSYCYYVASVVGLVCIKIFGYKEQRAEKLAEECGVAFQLTNIIRDVKEDALVGRIYLPEEDLTRFGVDADSFSKIGCTEKKAAKDFVVPENVRNLLEFEAERARGYYRSAEELQGLIDEDSRPALWVLVTIYQRLLGRITQKQYDVFHGKVRLSTWEKVSVLARGVAQTVIG